MADPANELFDVVDENNVVIGQETRGNCHREGIPHRAVYAFLFNDRGQLLIQKRAAEKKVGPNQWDLTVAEHLQPGESYFHGALRGLREELEVQIQETDLHGPLNEPHFRELVIPNRIIDREFVQSFWASGYTGSVKHNQDEVQAVRWVRLEEVEKEMRESPDNFTEWFRAEYSAVRNLLIDKQRALVTN